MQTREQRLEGFDASVWAQALPRGEGDQLRHLVHLQLPHRPHHAGPHLAVAALPLPRLQVGSFLVLFFCFLFFLITFDLLCVHQTCVVRLFSFRETCSLSKKRKTKREVMSERRIHEEYAKLGPIRCAFPL